MSEPLSPWDTFKAVVSSLSFSDALWIVIGICGVFAFYRIAVSRGRSEGVTWRAVLFWLIAILGWIFVMYMVTWRKILEGGFPGALLLTASAFCVTITVIVLTRRTRIWERVVSGAVIAIIGFGILATFGQGNQAWGFALVMGLTLGTILGLLVSSWRAMNASLDRHTDDVDQKDHPRREEKRRKVTEI